MALTDNGHSHNKRLDRELHSDATVGGDSSVTEVSEETSLPTAPKSPKPFPPAQFDTEPLHLLDDISEETSPELTPRVSEENETPRTKACSSSLASIPEDGFKLVPESLPDSGYKGEVDEEEDENEKDVSLRKPLNLGISITEEDPENVEGDTEYWDGGDTDVDSFTSDKDFVEFTDEEGDGYNKEDQSQSEKEFIEELRKEDKNPINSEEQSDTNEFGVETTETNSSGSSDAHPSVVEDAAIHISAVNLNEHSPDDSTADTESPVLTDELLLEANRSAVIGLPKELADALESEKESSFAVETTDRRQLNKDTPSAANGNLLNEERETADGRHLFNERDINADTADAFDEEGVTNQNIQDLILDNDGEYWIKDPETSGASNLSSRVREIVTKQLSVEDLRPELDIMSRPSSLSLEEENRMLQDELNRVEDLLATSRAERDEMSIKYNALSEKVERLVRVRNGDGDHVETTPGSTLLQQNLELRRRLEDEHMKYEKKLNKYQESQQAQALLVQKLQNKILQYKQKCAELEGSVVQHKMDFDDYKWNKSLYKSYGKEDFTAGGDFVDNRLQGHLEEKLDLETALVKLEEEQQRAAILANVNSHLQEQLNAATEANQSLTADIHKLTVDWQRTREELEIREEEWRDEEQSYNNYFTSEHNRLLTLWREIVAFQREFGEMKIATERDLTHLKNDFSKSSQNLCIACLSTFTHLSLGQSGSFQDKSIEEILEMNPTELWLQIQELTKRQGKLETDRNELKSKIQEMNIQIERLKYQLDEKEKTIRSLNRTVEQLETSKSEAVDVSQQELTSANRLRDEVEHLQNGFDEIAQIIEGADVSDETDLSYRRVERSPLRSRGRSLSPRSPSVRFRSQSPVFADAIVTSVKTAFNKKQLQIYELEAKLTASTDQHASIRKENEDKKTKERSLKTELQRAKEELDIIRRENENCQREKDRLRVALTSSSSEKDDLEENRRVLNEHIESLHQDNDKLHRANAELRRVKDELEDEKTLLMDDKDKQKKEIERYGKLVENFGEKNSALKEELIGLKESLNKTTLEKDIIEQEKVELSAAFNQIESQKGELEIQIAKLKTEEDSLRDSLFKLQVLNEGLGQDKIDLNRIITKLGKERSSLLIEKADAEQEKSGLQEELLRMEQERLMTESEKTSLSDAILKTEESKDQLQYKLSQQIRDTGELQTLLAVEVRKKSNLIEELSAVRRTAERQADQLDKLAKEKEQLARDRSELVVKVNGLEREMQSMGESLATFRNEKINLEVALYETQKSAQLLEAKRDQIVTENQELNIKRDLLQAQMNQLRKDLESEIIKLNRTREALNYKLQQTENEFTVTIEKAKAVHEEELNRMKEEKEGLRNHLESLHANELEKMHADRDDIIADYEAKITALQQLIEQMKKNHEEDLLIMESEHEQNVKLLDRRKVAVQEQLQQKQKEIDDLQIQVETVGRQADVQSEQDRSALAAVQEQLQNYHVQMEESAVAHEKSLKDVKNQLSDAYHQKDVLQQEMAELKIQLSVAENTRDNTRKELMDSSRRINQVEDQIQAYKKEIVELKRWLTETKHERETLQKSNDELRQKIKRSETERLDIKRSLEEAKQKNIVLEESNLAVNKEMGEIRSTLRDVEKSRVETRRETQDLRRQVQTLEGELNRKDQELGELRDRISREEQREDENKRKIYALKQKLTEIEANRDALRKELGASKSRLSDQEDNFSLREKKLQLALEDAHQSAAKLEEQKQHLENKLASSQTLTEELKIALSATQGQVGALDSQIVHLEGTKKDVENKLFTVNSSLRRFLGLRDRSVSPMRTKSPLRWKSPTRVDVHGSPRKTPIIRPSQDISQIASEIDPEAIRLAILDVMQQMAKTEKERDELKLQLRNLHMNISEKDAQQQDVQRKLHLLQRSLGSTEEDKRNIDSQLISASNTIKMHEETIQRNDMDRKILVEKISNLEQSLEMEANDKRQLVSKIAKMKQNENRQDAERQHLQETLKSVESHTSKLEVMKRALEGDLQRMRMTVNEKETENKNLQERLESHLRQIRDLEDKVASLQVTIDRLNMTLGKSTDGEHELKDKVEVLNRSLSERATASQTLQERVQHLQKSLTNSENERRVLEERLETAKQAVMEAKQQSMYLQDRANQFEQELSTEEQRRVELEGQMRDSETLLRQREGGNQDNLQLIQKLQEDKQILQDKLFQLQKSLSQWELERREFERTHIRLEKDKSALKKTLDKVEREKLLTEEFSRSIPQRSYERPSDQEMAELRRRTQMLESQLMDQEQHHSQKLIEMTRKHRDDKEIEIERITSAKVQAEKTLAAREKALRQRNNLLEQQIQVLRDQLNQEIRQRQHYITNSTKAGTEISELRSVLDQSLRNVSRDPTLTSSMLETETRKLDTTLGQHRPYHTLSKMVPGSPTRTRPRSPLRRTASMSLGRGTSRPYTSS